MAVKNGENVLSNGPGPLQPVSPPSLIAANLALIQELRQTNLLLLELVTQNAVLIDSLLDHEESEGGDARFDMAGNPIRVS